MHVFGLDLDLHLFSNGSGRDRNTYLIGEVPDIILLLLRFEPNLKSSIHTDTDRKRERFMALYLCNRKRNYDLHNLCRADIGSGTKSGEDS